MDWTVQGSNCGKGTVFFSPPKCPDCLYGPPSFLFSAYWALSWGVQWLGHEIYHSPVSGAKVKNEWSCTFTPLCPHGMDSETCIFFLLCVDAVIVLLLLLTFFEFNADRHRKSPVCHFFLQSSIFNLLRALVISCSYYSMWLTQIGTWISEELALSIFMVLPHFHL